VQGEGIEVESSATNTSLQEAEVKAPAEVKATHARTRQGPLGHSPDVSFLTRE
jgi:hypothetical protein